MKKKKKTFDPLPIASRIVKHLHVRRLSMGPMTPLLSYQRDSGLYVVSDLPIELEAQNRYLEKLRDDEDSDATVKDYHVQEILKAARRNAPVVQAEELNDPARGIVIFCNGVLDLASGELRSHSPDDLYTIGIPYEFDPAAECPRFEQFMAEILPPETHPLVREIMGYLLIPSAKYRKFFIFTGEGANGKSTLIEVIVEMLGRQNVSHKSLHEISGSRFGRADLFGKLANTYADLERHELASAGLLKQIVSGDSLDYEKKFRDPFTGPVTARLVFSANDIPIIRDSSEALMDRLIILDFPNRFEEKQQDRDLLAKLTTEAELQGIIAQWAIPGLQRLLARDRFTMPSAVRAILREYRLRSDPFMGFIETFVRREPNGQVGKTALFERYRKWCQEQDLPVSHLQRDFNKRVAGHFGLPFRKDIRAPASRERVWPGIELCDPNDPEEIPGKSQRKSASVLRYPGNPKSR